MRWGRRLPPSMGHALRVAAVTTGLVAVVYVGAAAVLDLVAYHRVVAQIDERLEGALAQSPLEDTAAAPERVATERVGPDLDDAPILAWAIDASGQVTSATVGAPAPPSGWSAAEPKDLTSGARSLRVQARRVGSGWLVVGESLAEASHVRSVLQTAELLVAPVVLLAVYLGALVVGVQAAAPVERTRRRQLEFTADASHELRTPLSVIEAEVDLARQGQRSGTYYRAAFERTAAETTRLRRIVDDLLWLARFDAEPPLPGHEPIDLVSLASVCARRFEPLAASRDVTVTVAAEAEAVLVRAPAEWVDKLVGVLLDNACRYTAAGTEVKVTVSQRGGRAAMAVEDHGPGIAPEEAEVLFDRFRRATDQPGGAGLGLAIADSVVKATNGRWRIGAVDGGGARLEVSWPHL